MYVCDLACRRGSWLCSFFWGERSSTQVLWNVEAVCLDSDGGLSECVIFLQMLWNERISRSSMLVYGNGDGMTTPFAMCHAVNSTIFVAADNRIQQVQDAFGTRIRGS